MTTQLGPAIPYGLSDSALDDMETVFWLLRRCRDYPAGPDDTPGMELVRAAMAAAADAPGGPEFDPRFWAVILRDLVARAGSSTPDAVPWRPLRSRPGQ